jgi:hypothetical protein
VPDESKHPDRLTALASGFVALLALAVSTYNVVLQRQQLRAQTWPHLEWSYSATNENFRCDLANTGVGPAQIRAVSLSLDGKPVATWAEFADRAMPDGRWKKHWGYSSIGDKVLGAGVELHPLTLPALSDDEAKALLRRTQLQLCYCSVLGDCWVLDGGDKPVHKCPVYPHPFKD